MTIAVRCEICNNPSTRKALELGWNAGMNFTELSAAFMGLGVGVITKHLKQHAENGGSRNVPVVISPMRERVLDIQRLQVEEIERRVALAQEKAEEWNKLKDTEGWEPRDWSFYFDILSKDMQAAVASILKTQALTDKREMKTADLKLGLFEAMQRHGLAPAAISGAEVPALPEPADD